MKTAERTELIVCFLVCSICILFGLAMAKNIFNLTYEAQANVIYLLEPLRHNRFPGAIIFAIALLEDKPFLTVKQSVICGVVWFIINTVAYITVDSSITYAFMSYGFVGYFCMWTFISVCTLIRYTK